ncbi:MAG: hypothetical protein HFI66_11050 [Lachnospiraceae bacterium]|jgi:hypothetical protein|nr:hypothetical protein [Lachnospiraceae bacterium]
MNISDALRLHIDETRRSSERENSLAVLKSYARMPIIEKIYLYLLGEEGDENKLEKVNNWIYDLRCNIAHFRYGQVKNNDTYEWNHIFALMLELLVSIYSNLDQNVQNICNGVVVSR